MKISSLFWYIIHYVWFGYKMFDKIVSKRRNRAVIDEVSRSFFV